MTQSLAFLVNNDVGWDSLNVLRISYDRYLSSTTRNDKTSFESWIKMQIFVAKTHISLPIRKILFLF